MPEKLPLGKFPYPDAVLNAILSSPYVNGEALGARQHKRDNRSGSTGSVWSDCSRPDRTGRLVLVPSKILEIWG